MIKTNEVIKDPYTDKEIELLLKKPNIKKCNFAEYRNWVLVNYLISTGNRIQTVINIKICDVDFENTLITLRHTKNRKQQIIPMSSSLNSISVEYLEYRNGSSDNWLFCSTYGQKLNTNSIYQAIKKHNIKHGVTKTSPHLFRHLLKTGF